MAEVEIAGIKCRYRDKRDDEEVLYANLEQDDQYFRREQHPFSDDELLAIAAREIEEHNYLPIQKSWVDKQRRIFEEGIYASIDGVVTFIPGAYWCYVNFWTLEHGEKPDYREDDRVFFLFHEYLRLETECLGVTRGKGRRQGATSIAMFFMWFIAGRKEHMNCGLTSFNDTAAQEAYQNMFSYGFKAMLPCFQADFDTDSENFIRFVKPIEKKKKGVLAVAREGLNSFVNYKPNTISSYDSGRQSYNVPDESGKRLKLNFNSYWSRLYKTFLVGSNKVGFAYMPTTVAAKKEGGENYKLFWNNANQEEIDRATGEPVGVNTVNRAVRYFVPATRCYAGCIDKFGRSVIDDPVEPVMSNEGKWIKEGSRTIITRERSRLSGEQLMEHRRDYPLDVWDMFAFETGTCEFDEDRLIAQIKILEEDPALSYWRRVRLVEGFDEMTKRIVISYVDDPKGEIYLKEEPDKPNHFSYGGGIFSPLSDKYSAGADTYKNIFAINGSDGAICVFKKSCIIDGKETGLYPVLFFLGRPKLIKQFNRIAFQICLYYGIKINYEIDAGTWFYEDFLEWNALDFLEWTPAVDPTKPNFKITPGTESANPFQLAKQLEVAKIFFDGNIVGGYNGNSHRVTYLPLLKEALEYNHEERTPYHTIVAFMMALLPIFAKPIRNMQKIPTLKLLPRYDVRIS